MLENLIQVLILIIAMMHFGFLLLEMFLWTRPSGLTVFRNSVEKAELTKVLAANQGLYNGFLVLGLIWSVFHPDPQFGNQLALFFLGCVVVAGIYGGYSLNKRIFFVQACPALLALVLTGLR
ncbi:MAG: putative membrane protein [Gammaproteobacteria bacterium]|jgi:putative membrane protein